VGQGRVASRPTSLGPIALAGDLSSWSTQIDGLDLSAVVYTDTLHCIAVGTSGNEVGLVYVTENGAKNWVEKSVPLDRSTRWPATRAPLMIATPRLRHRSFKVDNPAEVHSALTDLGLDLTRWYGVGFFTDHWRDVKRPEDFDQLLAAEEEAGRRDPYRKLASLTHYIAQRS
jgi:hypothetical protein